MGIFVNRTHHSNVRSIKNALTFTLMHLDSSFEQRVFWKNNFKLKLMILLGSQELYKSRIK